MSLVAGRHSKLSVHRDEKYLADVFAVGEKQSGMPSETDREAK